MRSGLSGRLPGGWPLAIFLAAVMLVFAGLAALELTRGDRVAEGVRVDGVDVGGRSSDEAAALIREEVKDPLQRTIVVVRGEREFELPPADSGIEVDVEATVDAALRQGRGSVPGVRVVRDLLGREVEVDIEPRVSYSQEDVGGFVKQVANKINRDPREAKIEPSAEGLETVSARDGFETNRDKLEDRVGKALESRERHRVEAPGKRTSPETTLADLAERHPHYIVVDRQGFRLRYYRELEEKSIYPISVGDAGHHTPAGGYDISTKAVDPAWHVPDKEWAGDKAGEVIPPGPENPIKARWLGIEDGIGIHGTDEPDSIGERASHGCIRMLIPDVKELYDSVSVGTPVYIG